MTPACTCPFVWAGGVRTDRHVDSPSCAVHGIHGTDSTSPFSRWPSEQAWLDSLIPVEHRSPPSE